MFSNGTKAQLHLNGKVVGDIVVQRKDDSWSHGTFTPNAHFSEFAEAFGRWSLLMHADALNEEMSEAAGEELRRVEYEIDRMKARLFFPESGEWLKCAQINIDGEMVEWKAY